MTVITRIYTTLHCTLRTHFVQATNYIGHCPHRNVNTHASSYIVKPLLSMGCKQQCARKETREILVNQTRHFSSENSVLCCPLPSRTLVKVKGNDSSNFLQGLVTNDMTILGKDQLAIYSMMLNVQGRVLYDLIIYLLPPEEEKSVYLMECDKDLADELVRTMNRYKIRKKITINPAGGEYKIWAILPKEVIKTEKTQSVTINKEWSDIICVADPRLPHFGHRLVIKDDEKVSDIVHDNHTICDEGTYIKRRYILGLSEGPLDLPPGNCTPLESNAAFLNGVSFSKGCYIGQELTARTHYTGVIRKRLMPISIQGDTTQLKHGTVIENEKGKNCGKFRNAVDSKGLALLRLEEAIGKGALLARNDSGKKIADIEATIPWWWPKESDEIIKQFLSGAANKH